MIIHEYKTLLDFETSEKKIKSKDIPHFALISPSIKNITNERELHKWHKIDGLTAPINIDDDVDQGK